jgi:hypothetical protein
MFQNIVILQIKKDGVSNMKAGATTRRKNFEKAVKTLRRECPEYQTQPLLLPLFGFIRSLFFSLYFFMRFFSRSLRSCFPTRSARN